MIVFDTEDHPVRERTDALQAAFSGVGAIEVALGTADGARRCRMDVWECEDVSFFASDATGLSLHRTSAHFDSAGEDLVSLTVQCRSELRYDKAGRQVLVRPGELALNDGLTAYSVEWEGVGGALAIRMSHDVLGIPAGVIGAAAPALAASPLYDLVRSQMVFLSRNRAGLEGTTAGEQVAQSTLALVRALVLSAADRHSEGPYSGEAELVEMILRFIRENLDNPGLTPAAVAAAHHVSLRQLYKLFHRGSLSVEQTIIVERLRAARDLLLRTGPDALSVTTIAYRVGFRDPSHFARRFRAEFGVGPSDWRSAHSARD